MFKDRFDAAQQLVPYLQRYANTSDALILAIPRGGLQLGSVLAKELHLPLDVILVKKIGYPGNPEYAIGAASLEEVLLSADYQHMPALQEYIAEETRNIQRVLRERSLAYRGDKKPLNLTHKIIIIVDDGVATGSTLLASIALVKKQNPKKIIIALPVAPAETLERLRASADEVICLDVPSVFFGVGQVYQHFEQVDDQEAIRLYKETQK